MKMWMKTTIAATMIATAGLTVAGAAMARGDCERGGPRGERAAWHQMTPEKMQERAGAKLEQLEEKLAIRDDQRSAWDTYKQSMLERSGEAAERMKEMHRFSGEGHSAALHSTREDRQLELAIKANVGRLNCNMPNAQANGGSWFNGHPTTDTLGCGTWAGNMTTDNVNWRHFLNYTVLSVPTPERVPTDEELFGDYLKRWGRD